MYQTDRTSGIFIVDSKGYLCSKLKLSLHMNDDLTLSHVEVNMINEEFEPARLPVKVLQHTITMGPMGSAPRWATAVGTMKIPSHIISGKAWDDSASADMAEYVLYALPLGVNFSHIKAHVEGLVSSCELQDWVESEYDLTFKEWVLGMVSFADNHAIIQQVLDAIHQMQGLELEKCHGQWRIFQQVGSHWASAFPFLSSHAYESNRACR